MDSSSETSVLAALEQAELAARERRLAASSDAADIVSAAEQRATAISARAEQRVDDALDRLRRATEAEADAAIEDLERVEAGQASSATSPGQGDLSVDQAVSIVVTHVLGEATSETDDGERA